MKIYKFGGASVREAAGVQNLGRIVSMAADRVVVVVSAMGKTTNALERVVDAMLHLDRGLAHYEWGQILDYHHAIMTELGVDVVLPDFASLPLADATRVADVRYADEYYDQIVSLGEMMSTRIVAAYLESQSISCAWLSMPDLLKTDTTFRDAVVDLETSCLNVLSAIEMASLGGVQVFVAQGFIGGTQDGRRTTLGREGSDYTAALLGNFLDADDVTIWKDVPGILNADPRLVEKTVMIPELSYHDAVELAYSGAQIIHPKTIRPLENKQIPLYVRPFGQPEAGGSKICRDAAPVNVPVYIWRKSQILITLRAKDFSFVLEESLSHIFEIIHRNRLRVSMIQSSAVTISVSVDNTRYVEEAIRQLQEDYRVTYNDNLSLLTIRGTSPEILREESAGRNILLMQTTRRTARLLIQN